MLQLRLSDQQFVPYWGVAYIKCFTVVDIMTAGARPTKHISIEFEIRWKFKTL